MSTFASDFLANLLEPNKEMRVRQGDKELITKDECVYMVDHATNQVYELVAEELLSPLRCELAE